ncbi:hypothetical protein SAMN04488127_2920 [Bhargavaea ginsengi]|uniref:Uncharacterized protein n=1 Tax=Bhargavaea ginsengi TaxID=426757 RepID=A0A1H7BZ64_9BACL|nr:hypothetical protein SAMN04488127_2920 [Bhargavaea ginsengi]
MCGVLDMNNSKIRSERYKTIKYQEAQDNEWRLLIYRILLVVFLCANIKYDLVDRIGLIPTLALIVLSAVTISKLLTLIFLKFVIK